MSRSRRISKSKYISGLQCEKKLWMEINEPELVGPVDAGLERRFEIGHRLNDIAHELFPGGVLIESEADEYEKWLASTDEAVKAGVPAIFEATFAVDNMFCRADAFVRVNNDTWDLYEVKSSTSVKDYHLHDVAFQRFCIESAGYKIRNTYLVHIDNTYVRKGRIDPAGLLFQHDVTKEIAAALENIKDKVMRLSKVAASKTCPEVAPGPHCCDPFECDFFAMCNKREPYDIYEMPSAGKLIRELEKRGIKYIADIPDDIKLSDRQRLTKEAVSRMEPIVDKAGIKEFLSLLEYPLYFFDFETIFQAIPPFDETRPYEQIPFQFSLHVQMAKGKEIEHHEFLAQGKDDPRTQLVDAMLGLLGRKGSILAYNAAFEKSVINSLAGYFKKRRRELKALLPRFVDLIIPFRKALYVHPDFHGSASLKKVLPALAPNLSYNDLEIQSGDVASLAYSRWVDGGMDETEWTKTREALLAYCGRDTLAMVELLRVLGQEAGKAI